MVTVPLRHDVLGTLLTPPFPGASSTKDVVFHSADFKFK
jgi:cation diffusion facilitator CzcD-associated flavoprotein CzcO